MLEQLTDNISIVSPNGKGNFPSSFCYYIDDQVKTIIDTPLDQSFVNIFNTHSIDMIINTHFHRDHSGCNHLFPDAKILAHPLDVPAMQSKDKFSQYYGLDTYASPELKAGLLQWLDFHPCTVDEELYDGMILDLGKTQLEVLHTPGHSPGHCALYERETGILFSGDIDLTGFGPWYGNVSSDVDDFIHSLERIILLKPRVILSGHKGMIDQNVQGRLHQYLDKIYTSENLILDALSKPLRLEELADKNIIYRQRLTPPEIFEYFERLSVLVHLRRLQKMGMVECHNGLYQRMDDFSFQASHA